MKKVSTVSLFKFLEDSSFGTSTAFSHNSLFKSDKFVFITSSLLLSVLFCKLFKLLTSKICSEFVGD